MKIYTAKNLDAALDLAAEELQIAKENIVYNVVEEKKSLFSKRITISIDEIADIIEFIENYVHSIIQELNLEVSLKTIYRDGLIKILIETGENNSILIGKNGETLQALTDLTKLAASNKYKRKFKILLDIGDYKNKKYSRVVFLAKKSARDVQKNHVDIKLDPMSPDERKKVHNALSTFANIKTESIGDGKDRAVVIKYVQE
ncbi:MAG: Jag family protein [Bacillales bacterium]